MGTVNITDITDGTTADADDVNSRLTAITDEVNGNLDSNNIATSGVGTNQIADDAVTAAKLDFQGCRVYLGGDQSISTGTATKIQFDTEDYDIGSNYDTVNHRFEAPITGYYRITLQCSYINLGDAKNCRAIIYINGSQVALNREYVGVAGAEASVVATTTQSVTAGQYIEFYAQHNHGSAISLDAQDGTPTVTTYGEIQLVGA